MPNLQFDTAKVTCILVVFRVSKTLFHPPVVSDEKTIQRLFGEAIALVGLREVIGTNAIVVDEGQHISIHNNRAKFLHQIGG